MKASGNGSWSLFRLSDRKQFDRVELSTIDFFYRAMPEALHTDWLMWREGFSGWRPFSELPLILKHLGKQAEEIQAPPVPESILQIMDAVTSAEQSFAIPTVEGEAKFEISTVSHSQSKLELKTKTAVSNVPSGANGAVLSDAGDELLENTNSSVSIRALQAAASSSFRRKTAGRGLNVGGAAGTKADRDGEAPADASGLHAVGGRVLTLPDEATMSLMLESQAASEDRNNVRYTKKFKVRIFTPKGIIVVSTIDCSVSGFKLRDPLPEGLPRFFHCEIDLGPEGKIPLICSEVKEKDGPAATRVRIQVNDHLQTFKSALMRAS